VLFTLKNSTDFTEFQRPCTNVIAMTTEEVAAGVKFSISSSVQCTLTVGFRSDNRTTIMSISQSSPITTSGVDRWRYTTIGTGGAESPVTCSS
jgi:hypothetical protein